MADSGQEGTLFEAQARAVLYNLFADAMSRKLDSSWLNPHFQSKLEIGLPEIKGKKEVLASLKRAAEEAEFFQEILLEYDALFIVPGPKLIFPYESCYTHRNIDGSFGRLWQEPAQDMQRILKEWDIKFAEGWNLIPDHIAAELFFMGYLCRLLSEGELGTEDRQKVKEWERRFLENHIRNWAFELLNNLKLKAETGFYKGIARLLSTFLEEESNFEAS